MILSMDILQKEKAWNSLRCSAHCLQLCVNSGLTTVSAVDRTVAAAKKLVGHFRHSVVASEELKERQRQMGVEQKRLVQSCATRWSSCYGMLLWLLEVRIPVLAVLSDENLTKRSDRYLELKSEQWAIVEELVSVLKLSYNMNITLLCRVSYLLYMVWIYLCSHQMVTHQQ